MSQPSHSRLVPTLPSMHAAFLLAGLATMLLGPILPILIRHWSLSDSQAGLLLLAQFTGATLGGATVSRLLPHALLLGLTCGMAGFLLFALAPGVALACAGLLLGGFGVGRVIASVNLIAGNRFTHQRGSALTRLNISFSLGCLLSPLLAAQLTPRFTLPHLLGAFAGLFLCLAAALLLELRAAPGEAASSGDATRSTPILTPIFLLFAAILFFYGGLETCLSGWLTTYALRYGQSSLVLSQYTMVLLLCGLTSGRILAAWLLTRIREATLLRIALILTISAATALALANGAASIAILAVVLGVCVAPVFPVSFALYMAHQPSARQGGLVLAASGLGAAAIPGLMGVVSTHFGSLKIALTLPIAAAIALLLFSLSPRSGPAPHEVPPVRR